MNQSMIIKGSRARKNGEPQETGLTGKKGEPGAVGNTALRARAG